MKSSEEQQLNDIITNLYACFASYTVEHPIAGSPISVRPAWQKKLGEKPLRELDAEILDIYVMKATSTWGTEHDFKHFLPRLLELIAQNKLLFWDMVFRNFASSKPPYEEQKIFEEYLFIIWKYLLSVFPSKGITSHALLNTLENIKIDITPYLQYWESALNQISKIRHLAECILSIHVLKHEPPTLMSWMCSEKLTDILINAYIEYEQADFSKRLLHASNHLEEIKLTYSHIDKP